MDKRLNTGFKSHVDVLVDKQDEKPDKASMDHIQNALGFRGKRVQEKWIYVKGLGYEKDWMYVIGFL